MEHCELFLLLPSYEDVEGQPAYIQHRDATDENKILTVIEGINKICRLIANEICKGYYDADNVSAFLYPVEVMEDCYPNIKTRMRLAMSRWGENWRTEKKQNDAERYMYYHYTIQDDTLCEMAERKFTSTDGSTFLLISYDAFSCKSGTIKVERNQEEVKLDVREADIKSISEWYEVNRKPQRVFNLNPKHGEYGKGAHPGNKGEKVSVLMCSEDEARGMLLKAIGINSKVLYFFDIRNNRYVEFKCESDHTYHGFHLDSEDEKRVPQEIKMMIKELI